MDKNSSRFSTLALYFVIGALLIGGYFLTHDDTPAQQEAPLSVKEEVVEQGVLKPIGVNMKNIATHILTKDDGSVVLLDKNSFDLDEYVAEKRVEVRGYFEKNQSGKDILKVENISAADAPEIQKDEKKPVEWDVYKSGDIGIMLKYRKDWTIEASGKTLKFKLPVAQETAAVPANNNISPTAIVAPEQKFDTITIELLSNTKKQTLDEYIAFFNDATVQKSKIGLDGTSAYKRTLGARVIFYADRESKFIYRISYDPDISKLFDSNKNIFYEIVSTLRFMPFGS